MAVTTAPILPDRTQLRSFASPRAETVFGFAASFPISGALTPSMHHPHSVLDSDRDRHLIGICAGSAIHRATHRGRSTVSVISRHPTILTESPDSSLATPQAESARAAIMRKSVGPRFSKGPPFGPR